MPIGDYIKPPEYFDKLKNLVGKFNKAEDYCRPYFNRGERFYKLYRLASSVKESEYPYVNMVRSRDIFAFVEDTTALLVQTLFATMPFYAIKARETSQLRKMIEGIDPDKVGEQMERCLAYQVEHEETEFFEEIIDYLKGGNIFGNSYMGVYPHFERDGRYLRPQLTTHDFFDVLPLSFTRRLNKSRGVFIREFKTIPELEDLESKGVYKNVGEINEAVQEGIQVTWHADMLSELGIKNYDPDPIDIELLHYFEGGHVITIANRKIFIRDSTQPLEEIYGQPIRIFKPYPYDLPVVQYKYIPVPLEFFGMGIPEVLEVLQEDKNLIRSARRDNIDICIHKILKMRANADINTNLIKYYPSAIWPLENLTDIEEMEMQDVTQSSYQEESLVQQDMENALSLFGYARGMTPKHSEQPTTVMKLQQASLNRMDLAVKLAEFTVLQNIASRIILLTRKYMKQEDYEAIVGDTDAGFFKMSEEQIKRFYIIKPVGSSVTHIKELRQQQMQFAFERLSAVPPEIALNPAVNAQPYIVNWYEAQRAGLETADVRNIDKILIPLGQQQAPMPMAPLPLDEASAMSEVPYGV